MLILCCMPASVTSVLPEKGIPTWPSSCSMIARIINKAKMHSSSSCCLQACEHEGAGEHSRLARWFSLQEITTLADNAARYICRQRCHCSRQFFIVFLAGIGTGKLLQQTSGHIRLGSRHATAI